MSFEGRAQSRATQATSEALITFRIEARRDGVVTDEEAEVECLLETAYLINEEQDCAEQFAEQLKRCPSNAPNVHLMKRFRDLERAWKHRNSLMSDKDNQAA